MRDERRLIGQLQAQGLLSDLDVYFADLLLAKSDQPSELLALAAAMTSRVTNEGHVCFDLNEMADRPLNGLDGQVIATVPSLHDWSARLHRSGVVGTPGEHQPLILDASGRLYLHRYWKYEHRLGFLLDERAGRQATDVDETVLRTGLKQLFPNTGDDIDWQKQAAAAAVLRRLSVISGGPGTGKTTTVMRLLALLRQQPGGEALRFALAAPTGKAAGRLQETIQQSRDSHPAQMGSLPELTSTLHRLLGVRHGSTSFVHNRDNPLALDVLVLDEASMVPVALMAKLLEALPDSARLILLGDKDQLASVEAGAVLGDICSGYRGPTPHFAEQLQRVTGESPLSDSSNPRALADSVVVLKKSYRFDSASPIGRLAGAVNTGNFKQAWELLEEGGAASQIRRIPVSEDTAKLAAGRYAKIFEKIGKEAAPSEIFASLNDYRVLCAMQQGPDGVTAVNRRIEAELRSRGYITGDSEWFQGRPVLVTRNSYGLGLYNGDIGVALPNPQAGGEISVVFPVADGSFRWIAPARLPEHQTVFAMTVHKSQGSEFNEVLLQLPARDNPLLTRELLYTAITRARSRFYISTEQEVFHSLVHRQLRRNSGLAEVLWQ
ncbi:MAG: exodeoxyribonuclease V subunit alpha [endosymbiont of Seepiophila jonesi]|uniref:RecBCD enzyme subunit RecD n=1 Tax=endosymbiont of Lamellibrachia luymesi TaxID=2200907 RepID=A0A370E0J7_9GAMM|nr:MAG: exodeoxyribonuclease V subunit alpha [endosymbiont of Seepiophila jonesi]RDH92976.1 MAG: exodeoxyribonuclease V subunit alpha [endosymbiont of Lamellibrachia luymesi]